MADFPSTLPQPLASGYGISPLDQTVRTDMEVGAARVRRRTSARLDRVTLSWIFTDAQLATFRAWFENDSTGAAGGASWFNVNLAIGTTGLVAVQARFVGVYKADHLGALIWSVSAEVEVR